MRKSIAFYGQRNSVLRYVFFLDFWHFFSFVPKKMSFLQKQCRKLK